MLLMFVLTDANAATCALVLNLIELNSLLIFHYSVIDRFKLCLANGHHQNGGGGRLHVP